MAMKIKQIIEKLEPPKVRDRSQPDQADPSRIEAALHAIDVRIMEIGAVLDVLEAKLGQVLMPSTDKPSEQVGAPVGCPMGHRLANQDETLRLHIVRLQDIVDRCEL